MMNPSVNAATGGHPGDGREMKCFSFNAATGGHPGMAVK
jgi:hypothetical protein